MRRPPPHDLVTVTHRASSSNHWPSSSSHSDSPTGHEHAPPDDASRASAPFKSSIASPPHCLHTAFTPPPHRLPTHTSTPPSHRLHTAFPPTPPHRLHTACASPCIRTAFALLSHNFHAASTPPPRHYTDIAGVRPSASSVGATGSRCLDMPISFRTASVSFSLLAQSSS